MVQTIIAHYDESGSIEAIRAASTSESLFTVQVTQKDDFESTMLDSLKKWACTNRNLYKLPVHIQPDMLNIKLSSVPTYVNKRISISRFEQIYRGFPVYGHSQYITLTIVDRREVRKISGQIIDDQQPYRGLTTSISNAEAIKSMKDHWMQRFPDTEISVREVRKVAISNEKVIGFVGEINERIFSSSRLIRGAVIIDAETGNLILINDFKFEAGVRGRELTDNPRTETQVDYDNIPATLFGNTIHFEPNPLLDCDPPGWRDFRMGNDTRFIILNFKGTKGTDAEHITVGGCLSGTPSPLFHSSIGFRFLAQDLIVKTYRSLNAIDPLMGELITHNAAHSYSWNHHPNVPQIAHRSPLMIAINCAPFCDGATGRYNGIWVSEHDTNIMELPVPHPLVYVCRNANDEIVSCSGPDVVSKEQYISLIGICASFPFQTRVLFHEIGHYYDNFNAHGMMNEALREIVSQLFCLYLHRKLYPELTYTLSTLPEEGHCDLGYLISHSAGIVVHPDCVDQLSDIAQSINVTNNGYSIRAFTQAYWSLLFGVTCSAENIPIECNQPNNLPPNYEDRWMEALLFALQMGNEPSFVELWENIELFIESNYPDDLDFLQSVRALHGLQ